MAVTSLERLLGMRTLAGLVEVFAREEANSRAAVQLFEQGAQRLDPLVDGSFEWDEVSFGRHLAAVQGRGAPSIAVTPLNRVVRSSAPAHVGPVSVFIPAHRLHSQRGDGELLPNAPAVIAREMRNLAKLLGNTKEYLAMRALFGTVTVSNATIPGTTAPFTLSFGLNTGTATSSWATASTPIVSSELTNMKLDYMQAIGMNGRIALTTQTVVDYLRGNSQILNLLQQTYGQQLARSAAELFSQSAMEGLELGGLNWRVTEEGYVPEGGSFTRYIPATDKIALLPEVSALGDVLGQAEGYGLIPALGGDVLAAEGAAFATRQAPGRGMYAYAVRTVDPLGVKLIMGWTGIYVILTPNGILVWDVVP